MHTTHNKTAKNTQTNPPHSPSLNSKKKSKMFLPHPLPMSPLFSLFVSAEISNDLVLKKREGRERRGNKRGFFSFFWRRGNVGGQGGGRERGGRGRGRRGRKAGGREQEKREVWIRQGRGREEVDWEGGVRAGREKKKGSRNEHGREGRDRKGEENET